MRVDQETRDSLARVASKEMGGVSLDEALRTVLFEHESRLALARLASTPEAWAEYREETTQVAEGGVEVIE
jgi:hypothetical protein